MGYIKQITIQGFKSYKAQTEIEPFSPKSNVVVGRNGSGKSNFFAAVRFVLGDDYTNMNREERQALLHEGSGSAVMSAYVEVCFDNTDKRFPIEKDEVLLRRTIGLKKDEYSIDRKNATKTEVFQILESAGFAKENPYYIVPQGRVTALTNMKDSQRLTLLKDISGSQAYDDKKRESEKILADTDAKKDHIDRFLGDIETRLDELHTEKEELEAFNNKDRERRALRYAMERQTEERWEREIAEIDDRRQNRVADKEEMQNRFVETEQEIGRTETRITELKSELELLHEERAQLEADRRDSARTKAKIELDIKDLTEGQSTAQKAKKLHETRLRHVQQTIKARQDDLKQLLPEYTAKKDEEANIKSQLVDAEGQRKRLEDKQGRTTYYSNKRERDQALRREVDDISQDMAQQKAVLMQTREQIDALQDDIKGLEAEIPDLESRIENQGDNTMDAATKVQRAKDAMKDLDDNKKELWREGYKVQSQVTNARDALSKAESNFNRILSSATIAKGLDTLREIKKLRGFEGVYGTIADLVKVKRDYKISAESHAGNNFFHVIVDNDDTSSRVIDELNKRRGGRLTLIPLNRVSPRPVQYPRTNDAVPLIQKLTYDQKYESAVQSVFGKAIVCPDLSIASSIARSHGLDALTIEGDQADKRGRLTGGWRDPSATKLDAYERVAEARSELEELLNRQSQNKRDLEQVEHKITKALTSIRQNEQERGQIERSYEPMRHELRAKQAELLRKKDSLDDKERTAARIDSDISNLGAQQSDLEADLASDFKKTLSRDEEQTLATLTVSVQNLRRQAATLTGERSELEYRKQEIELELRQNLEPILDQLQNEEGSSTSASGQPARLKEAEKSLSRINKDLKTIDGKIAEVDRKIDEVNGKLAERTTSKDEMIAANIELSKTIEKHKSRMDRSMQDRQRAQVQLKECQQRIRELGTLPDEAWQKYANKPEQQLQVRLDKVNNSLKKYSKVNKKAFEQYENFTRQRKDLTGRLEDLVKSRDSISNLIAHLDHRKDEAIQRTFKQVSKAFSEVFGQLVPAGIGRLIIQRKSDREAAGLDDDDSDEEQEAPQRNRGNKTDKVANYAGVGIQVSFNSKHDEQQRISQLSGGQKSLCALALVFAIQQCDPAPFYLFDEIDANLDAQYRTAVAQMLEKLAGKGGDGQGGGQFIVTTFRPEMVQVADKCYGVAYTNKTSSIDVVAREEALKFVEGQTK
ncbi:RecF/RecN/SMC [Lophiotrema nucula]|uniref:Structural maintenance of chromosomes protein n=1 Tax=Lophiotrema nucula TaxID=690887 RepID=A0A6A5YKS9_9PLEO|nr:RecF/RecN/SMC [Lophiotrema nucula]